MIEPDHGLRGPSCNQCGKYLGHPLAAFCNTRCKNIYYKVWPYYLPETWEGLDVLHASQERKWWD